MVVPAPLLLVSQADALESARSASYDAGTKTSGYFKYRIEKDGTATIVGCDREAIDYDYEHASRGERIAIPATIEGAQVVAIADDALDAHDFISDARLTLPEGLKRIGARAMRGWEFDNLPSTLEEIGDEAFATDPYWDGEDTTEQQTVLHIGGKLPAGLKKVGKDCFSHSKIGKSLTVPSALSSIGTRAFNCAGLKTIRVAKGNKKYLASGGKLLTKRPKRLVSYALGRTETAKIPQGVKKIPNRMFARANMKKVVIPASVKHIGERAFELCKKLKKIKMPNGVTSVGAYACFGCERLQKISMPKKLRSIEDGVFEYCEALRGKVVIPKKVKSVGCSAFRDCELADIRLPRGLRYVGEDAFYGCKRITKVCLPKIRTIGSIAFAECSSLKSVKLSSKLKTIGYDSFKDCKRLKSVTLGKSLKKVGAGAFSGTSKKLAFKAPKSKVKAYKKLLRKAGVKKPKVRAL